MGWPYNLATLVPVPRNFPAYSLGDDTIFRRSRLPFEARGFVGVVSLRNLPRIRLDGILRGTQYGDQPNRVNVAPKFHLSTNGNAQTMPSYKSMILALTSSLMSDERNPTPPKPESVAPLNSSKVRSLFDTYLDFLAAIKKKIDASNPPYKSLPEHENQSPNKQFDIMSKGAAAIFDASNPASPLAYSAKQTALFLLDFQGFCLAHIEDNGVAVVSKAKVMRDWAFQQEMMVVHSLVDVTAQPPATCKGGERIKGMLAQVAQDRESAGEAAEIAFAKQPGEYVVLKHPGVISGLKSAGAMQLLEENGIRSLILCGIATSGAVLRTAIPATDDGFVVSVIEDACAARTVEVHEAVVRDLLPSRAHIATADEFIKAWEDGKR